MAHEDYKEPDLTPEDPDSMTQGRWRWTLPVVLLVLTIAGMYGLAETTGHPIWPSHNAWLRGSVAATPDAVGTAGRAAPSPESAVASDSSVIRDVETITGLVDAHPLIGRKVDLHIPVSEHANDEAFWIGQGDNRVLVVLQRDRRDGAQRQEGLIATSGIAPLEAGKTAEISGSIQKLPASEEMYSWGLTRRDVREAAAMGVFLRADQVSVQ
jgi:hypothetical protein